MPIQIPRLQQLESTQTQPTNRLNLNVQNNADTILRSTSAVTSLVKEGIDVYDKYRSDTLKQLNYEIEQKYDSWTTQKLIDLKAIDGDPTKPYVDYEKEEEEKSKELLSDYPDLDDEMKGYVTAKLDKVRNAYKLQSLAQRGKQQEVYKNNLFESTISLKKNTLPSNAGFVREGDPTSFLPFDENISDIKTVIAQRGLENGTVTKLSDDAQSWNHIYKDDDGKIVKVSMSEMAKQRTAKEVSEGVTSSIKAMIDAGEIKRAKALHEKYGDFIDAKSNGVLVNRFKNQGLKDEALVTLSDISKKPEDKQLEAIDKLPVDLQGEVLKIKSANDSRRELLKKNQQEANFDLLLKDMDYRRKNGQLNGVADLENSQVYKETFDKLSRQQQQSVLQEFEAPKKTDPKALIKVQELFINGDINNTSSAQFQESLVGLSKEDKTRYETRFLNIKENKNNLTKTSGVNKRAADLLKNKLYATGLIKNDEYGKLDKKNYTKLTKANDDLIDYLEAVPTNISDKDLSDQVNKYISEKKKTELFGGGSSFLSRLNPFGNDDDTPKPATTLSTRQTPNDDPLKGLDAKQIFKLQRDYKKQTRTTATPHPSDKAFLNYVRSLGK